MRTDEDGAGVAHAGGDVGGVAGLDLEVLGGIRVDDVEAGVDVVDEDDARLRALEGLGDPLGVLRGRRRGGRAAVGAVGELLAVGDEDRRGERVVLGLADEVGGDVVGVGGVVGEDRRSRSAGLGVDADEALEQALGGDDPDVAGAGDERHGRRRRLAVVHVVVAKP